jgi:hypothetical protein
VAVDKMRRIEQRTTKSLKGLRWSLLKDRSNLNPEAAADLGTDLHEKYDQCARRLAESS